MRDGGGAHVLCDTHMHVYGPVDRFPCDAFEVNAALDDYLALRARLEISRTVYVQPSAYGRDHGCLLDALERDRVVARAVGILGTETPLSELERYHAAGMRGVRFHDLTPGCLPMDDLEAVAEHIAPLGWHVVVQFAGERLPEFERRLSGLPCDAVIDHMGLMPVDAGLEHPAIRSLLSLLESRRCWVKLSAPYVVSGDGACMQVDRARLVRAMIAAAPDRLIWGTNWPHPRFGPASKPDDAFMLDSIRSWCGDAWPGVAGENAARLYGFPDSAD